MHEHNSDIISGWRAGIYNRLMAAFGVGHVYERVLAEIELSEGQGLLDIGCGTGTFLKLARKKFRAARLMGVDASPDMLREARRGADSSIAFIEADASILPFPNHSVDCVVSILAFHHMSDGIKVRAIQEISRVLKPKGKCLIADFGRPATTWWGVLTLFFLNFHSHTRGSIKFVERELTRWRFTIERRERVWGPVAVLHARRQ